MSIHFGKSKFNGPKIKASNSPNLEVLEDRRVPASLSQWLGASGMYETKETALNLGIIKNDVDRTDLKLDGQADWIKFQTREKGGIHDRIFVTADQGGSKLNLQLFDSKGNLLGESGGRAVDFTSIKLTDLPAGVFYAAVTGINHATAIRYRMHVDAPVLIGTQNDSYESNNSADKAKDLGLVPRSGALGINAKLPKNDQDWYTIRFPFLAGSTGPGTQVIVSAPQGWSNNWHLEVYDSQKHLVGISSGASAVHGVSLSNRPAGAYKVHIFSDDDRGIGSYNLLINKVLFNTQVAGVHPNASNSRQYVAAFSNPVLQLPDSQLNSLVNTLLHDGQMSRQDWIGPGGIFETVQADGMVNSSEFASLQTLVNNATILDNPSQVYGSGLVPMYDYVFNLAGKIINGDFANASYQGLPLGNLAVGSSANQLEQLVDKWFLGMDDPDAGHNYAYVEANGNPLFGTNGPLLSDINQGNDGDCYYLSSLGSILSKQLTGWNPDYFAIYNPLTGENTNGFFIDNGDGTYSIRFYYQSQTNGSWVSDYVTVDQYFPTTGTGTNTEWVYANAYADFNDTTIPLWVAMMEKAYVQENASARWSPQTSASSVSNNYQTISGLYDANQALMQLTGQNGYIGISNFSNLNFKQIVTAYTNGVGVVFGTKNNPAADLNGGNVDNDNPVVTSHDYMMYGFNSVNQTVLLQNPWGNPYYGTYDSVNPPASTKMTYLFFEATIPFLQGNFNAFYGIGSNSFYQTNYTSIPS